MRGEVVNERAVLGGGAVNTELALMVKGIFFLFRNG